MLASASSGFCDDDRPKSLPAVTFSHAVSRSRTSKPIHGAPQVRVQPLPPLPAVVALDGDAEPRPSEDPAPARVALGGADAAGLDHKPLPTHAAEDRQLAGTLSPLR